VEMKGGGEQMSRYSCAYCEKVIEDVPPRDYIKLIAFSEGNATKTLRFCSLIELSKWLKEVALC
jgi:hypothetical protein